MQEKSEKLGLQSPYSALRLFLTNAIPKDLREGADEAIELQIQAEEAQLMEQQRLIPLQLQEMARGRGHDGSRL